jgi:hypothetical protein
VASSGRDIEGTRVGVERVHVVGEYMRVGHESNVDVDVESHTRTNAWGKGVGVGDVGVGCRQ